jgi:hypothetical protein
MAKKKARDRADEFITSLGTAGGPIGSPGLISFGGSDIQAQVFAGNSDQYAPIRMRQGDVGVGDPNAAVPPMPQDLDASYLKLNLPGSPLPVNALLSPQNQMAAEFTQNQIAVNEQLYLRNAMNPVGLMKLPVGNLPPQKKGRR